MLLDVSQKVLAAVLPVEDARITAFVQLTVVFEEVLCQHVVRGNGEVQLFTCARLHSATEHVVGKMREGPAPMEAIVDTAACKFTHNNNNNIYFV